DRRGGSMRRIASAPTRPFSHLPPRALLYVPNRSTAMTTNCTGYERYATRRQFLRAMGGGLGMLALADLLAADDKLAGGAAGLHHAATAKRVLLLFMSAGVSHVDTFDRKPALEKYHGQELTGKGDITDVFFRKPGKLMRSPFQFQQYGETGKWV